MSILIHVQLTTYIHTHIHRYSSHEYPLEKQKKTHILSMYSDSTNYGRNESLKVGNSREQGAAPIGEFEIMTDRPTDRRPADRQTD